MQKQSEQEEEKKTQRIHHLLMSLVHNFDEHVLSTYMGKRHLKPEIELIMTAMLTWQFS